MESSQFQGRLREKIQKGLRVSQGRCGRSREGRGVAACRSDVGCCLEAQGMGMDGGCG